MHECMKQLILQDMLKNNGDCSADKSDNSGSYCSASNIFR
jgi:hypothetical protein